MKSEIPTRVPSQIPATVTLPTPPGKEFAFYWSLIAAVLLAVFYLATSIHIASRRLFWFDELLTVLISRLPRWTEIWTALLTAPDTMPPTYYMSVRIFENIFGNPQISARLPSALGMTMGLLVTYDCVRRLTDGRHGLIALSFLTCTCLPNYGFEARSYGLYFMLAALSLWIWTQTRNDKGSSAMLFGLVFLLAVTIHYYALICLLPYAVWEVLNWKPWQLPSKKMIAGLLGVLCAVLFLWTPITAERRGYPISLAHPSLNYLRASLPGLFPDGVLLVSLIMLWIAVVGVKDRTTPQPMQSSERVGWLFLLIPLAAYVPRAWVATHPSFFRYVIGTLPGVAVAFSCLMWRHFRDTQRVSIGILLLLTSFGVAKQVILAQHPERIDTNKEETLIRQTLDWEGVLQSDGKRFRVVCEMSMHLGVFYYSKQPERYALLIFSDEGAKPGQVTFADIRSEATLANYYPLKFWSLEDIRKHARETAIIAPYPSILDSLKEAGLRPKIRSAAPLEIVYLE